MARKTITVASLVSRVNNMLAVTDDDMRRERIALSVLLESVLMDTDNYRGFGYLPSEFNDGKPENGFRDGYDGTRRKYFGGE